MLVYFSASIRIFIEYKQGYERFYSDSLKCFSTIALS